MITRQNNRVLLQPKDIAPSHSDLEVIGILNPGAVRVGDEIILLVRVMESSRHKRAGWLHAPRILSGTDQYQYEFDWVRLTPELHDKRKPKIESGLRRLANISHIEVVRLTSDGLTVSSIHRHPELFGQTDEEIYGIEDARITQIDDAYWISYVAVSLTMGDCTGLMSTRDFHTFTRHGIIFPWENKDVVFFPERFAGKYLAFDRPLGETKLTYPSIVLATSPDMKAWGNFRLVLSARGDASWQSNKIGTGTPPIRTEQGWLWLYHGVKKRSEKDIYGTYSVGAVLSDLKDPKKIVARSETPILTPETDFEKRGFMSNVVFPTGAVKVSQDNDKLLIYYGAADTVTAVMTVSIREIIKTLIKT